MSSQDLKMTITIDQKEKIDLIAREYGLRLVLLFGSEITGKLHQGSDMDIAVMFEDAAAVDDRFFDLIADLQVAIQAREIDLGLINGADPLFLKKILENCELVSGEPRSLAELKMYAFRRYIDHKRFLKMEEQYVQRLLNRFEKGAA